MTRKTVTGVLKTWKEDRGFGFIKPNDGGKDIFIHISALDGESPRPRTGDVIHYQVSRDSRGKFKAINAQIEGASVTKNKPKMLATLMRHKLITIGLVLTIILVTVTIYIQSLS